MIEDPELVNTYIHSGAWDYTDIPLAEETEVVTVKAWLPTDEDLPSKLEQLRLHIDEMSQFLDKGSGVINCSEIQDEDWANNWKQFSIQNALVKNCSKAILGRIHSIR